MPHQNKFFLVDNLLYEKDAKQIMKLLRESLLCQLNFETTVKWCGSWQVRK